MQPQPISPYGVTKYVGELYDKLRAVLRSRKMLRSVTSHFWPGRDPGSPYSGVLAKFCTAFLEETQPVVFGDGEQTRDFTFVENACRPTFLPARRQRFGKGLTSAPGGHSLNKVLKALEKLRQDPRSQVRTGARRRYP